MKVFFKFFNYLLGLFTVVRLLNEQERGLQHPQGVRWAISVDNYTFPPRKQATNEKKKKTTKKNKESNITTNLGGSDIEVKEADANAADFEGVSEVEDREVLLVGLLAWCPGGRPHVAHEVESPGRNKRGGMDEGR